MRTAAGMSAGLRRSWHEDAGRWRLGFAVAALAACLLRPGWTVERARFDLVVVLDVTQSMDVQDVAVDGRPASRLGQARALLRRALLRLPCGSKLGWAVFTEYRTFLLLEPVEVCANLGELRSTLALIDGRMAWSGNSEVAKGLHSAIVTTKQLAGRPGLVFVTDGHEAPPLSSQHRPSFDDKPGDVRGLIVGVGGFVPAPIPKADPQGRPLGVWRADEVAQADLYRSGRGGRVGAEAMTGDGAAAVPLPALGATPGSEHLSALREPYLRLLGRELGLGYLHLDSAEGLAAALTAGELGTPTPVRFDGRGAFAGAALALLLAPHLAALRRRRRPRHAAMPPRRRQRRDRLDRPRLGGVPSIDAPSSRPATKETTAWPS